MSICAITNLERQRSELALMPRPRTVSIAWERLTGLFFFVCIWGFFLFALWENVAKSDYKTSSFSGIIFPGIAVTVFAWFFVQSARAERAARQLLMTGDCAVGRVILQEWKGRRGKYSEISFEFKDEIGNRHHGTAIDSTRACSVGSSVLVFYLHSNPSKNVASCCTFWQVRASDEYVFEP
jgi:hypothetical protein